jgi:hypothetical protein
MTEKRKFEYHLLRCVPNAVRGEGVNIGLVMMEVGGDGGGFAGVHFTKDWRRALCMYPETDVEMLESFGRELTQGLADAQKRALMLREMLENYSNMLQLSEARQWATENPEKDLRQLAAELVEAPRFGLAEAERSPRMVGRKWIHSEMGRTFRAAGVWNFLLKELPAAPYTNQADDFTFDFAYAAGGEVKLFHAVSLAERLKEAELFAFRVAKIGPAMARMRGETPRFTSVVEDGYNVGDSGVAAVVALMKGEEIRVAEMREMAGIAERARVELRA